jgi:hypothetical protein
MGTRLHDPTTNSGHMRKYPQAISAGRSCEYLSVVGGKNDGTLAQMASAAAIASLYVVSANTAKLRSGGRAIRFESVARVTWSRIRLLSSTLVIQIVFQSCAVAWSVYL